MISRNICGLAAFPKKQMGGKMKELSPHWQVGSTAKRCAAKFLVLIPSRERKGGSRDIVAVMQETAIHFFSIKSMKNYIYSVFEKSQKSGYSHFLDSGDE